MAKEFQREKIELFLGAVRKYMQVRGGLSQKDLAEKCEIGVSTMSRFLNQQTKDLNPQLIARIAAELNIPLHEIIDFVDEDYTKSFIRLVKFYKGEPATPEAASAISGEISRGEEEELAQALGPQGGTAERNVTGQIKMGGKTRTVSYERREDDIPFGDKIHNLSRKQKGFLYDFLNLDMEGKDLVADIGANVIAYLRQKGIDF